MLCARRGVICPCSCPCAHMRARPGAHRRPSLTAATMVAKLSSARTILAASLDTSVPADGWWGAVEQAGSTHIYVTGARWSSGFMLSLGFYAGGRGVQEAHNTAPHTDAPVIPMATPMSAALSAGASLTPSPVMATTLTPPRLRPLFLASLSSYSSLP